MVRRAVPVVVWICLICISLGVQARDRRASPGKRMDLNLHQARVADVMRLLSDVAGINFVLDHDVSGKVTVRLRNVRWQVALRAILKSRGLELQWEDNVLRVARRETLAAEREARLKQRKACQQHGELVTRLVRPSYASAAKLAPLIRSLLSPRGRVMVDQRTNTLIVRDVSCK